MLCGSGSPTQIGYFTLIYEFKNFVYILEMFYVTNFVLPRYIYV